MENQIKRAGAFVLAAVLSLSIAFGFFKQAKSAWESRSEYAKERVEPGAAFLPLKNELAALKPGADPSSLRLAYQTDRIQAENSRDVSEFWFDAQYAMAPYILSRGIPAPDCAIFDPQNGAPRLDCGEIR